ncbi:unnamed protein product [Rotaria sp. Silwood1]|nr:unnamed protein product [Rotaria sp. Silwood1]CAF1622714.1 unnamed protein product [Rotaria sp. Silwood1]CAF1622795.1 unnamed protein product [Rotaria sp. Silwood1]CAF3720394.1 unnamed protein product [Rotaria sp. Silwood1]CAF3751573.1 unnamed protein product [Rotaria sp. Silwood1]
MSSNERRGHERSASAEFNRVDRTVKIQNAAERLRSEMLNYVTNRFEEFSSEIKQASKMPSINEIIQQPIVSHSDLVSINKVAKEESSQTIASKQSVDIKKKSSAFPTKIFRMRSSILTELLEVSHIRSIRQIFVSILVLLVLQVAITDLFEKGRVDFQFDVIRWNFSNLSACLRLWFFLFMSTCAIVYYCFHFWAYKRLSLMSINSSIDTDEFKKKTTSLMIFDWLWLSAYCCYFGLFLYIPVHIILEENYPIVTRMIILIEQVRFLMKSHAFVRENAPHAILYGQIYSQRIKVEDIIENKSNDSLNEQKNSFIPHTPCPEFSKFLYFLFAPTLIYRDSYPRTSSVRWKFVISQLVQFATTSLFAYYLFYRFCLPVFRHFNSEHVTLKIFVLSILNCTLPGALLLFCTFYGFLHCWLNAFAEMLRFADRQFYSDWWTATSWSSYYRTWNIVVHDWLYTYVYRDCHKLLGVKYRLVSMYAVIFLSACVHEYIISLAFGYFYPILFIQFAILGFISMLILPQRTQNNAFNVFIWASLFVGLGMQMCLYSIEWYARQNCPRSVNGPLDYFIPRSFFCRENDIVKPSISNNIPNFLHDL